MNSPSLVGFWKFKSNRVRQEDGEWFNEEIYGGVIAFSEANEVCLFVRSTQGPWGYSGKYQFDGDVYKVQLESCISEDIEGSSLERTIRFINKNEFIMIGRESHTERVFEAVYTRSNLDSGLK